MKYKLNNYNYITEYATIGDLMGDYKEISIDHLEHPHQTNFLEYQVIDGKLKHNPIPVNTNKELIMPTWDGKGWTESRDTEIVLPILEEKMMQIKIRLMASRELRFDTMPLEIELEQLHKKHDEIIAHKGA